MSMGFNKLVVFLTAWVSTSDMSNELNIKTFQVSFLPDSVFSDYPRLANPLKKINNKEIKMRETKCTHTGTNTDTHIQG